MFDGITKVPFSVLHDRWTFVQSNFFIRMDTNNQIVTHFFGLGKCQSIFCQNGYSLVEVHWHVHNAYSQSNLVVKILWIPSTQIRISFPCLSIFFFVSVKNLMAKAMPYLRNQSKAMDAFEFICLDLKHST